MVKGHNARVKLFNSYISSAWIHLIRHLYVDMYLQAKCFPVTFSRLSHSDKLYRVENFQQKEKSCQISFFYFSLVDVIMI